MDRTQYKPVPDDYLEMELAALENFIGSAGQIYYMDQDTADRLVSLLAELQTWRSHK